MNRTPQKTDGVWRGRPLSWWRIIVALLIAMAADVIQFILNGPGWFGPDQIIDVITMLAIIPLIGFHWLLLPSFVLELVPVLEDLPTWTGCVLAVVAIRKHQANSMKPAKIN